MPLKLQKLWLAIGTILIVFIVVLGVIPVPEDKMPIFPYADKILHIIGYLLLMLWFTNIFSNLQIRIKLAVGFVLLGSLIELVQYFLPYRSFEASDLVANSLGIAFGLLLGFSSLNQILQKTENIFIKIIT